MKSRTLSVRLLSLHFHRFSFPLLIDNAAVRKTEKGVEKIPGEGREGLLRAGRQHVGVLHRVS